MPRGHCPGFAPLPATSTARAVPPVLCSRSFHGVFSSFSSDVPCLAALCLGPVLFVSSREPWSIPAPAVWSPTASSEPTYSDGICAGQQSSAAATRHRAFAPCSDGGCRAANTFLWNWLLIRGFHPVCAFGASGPRGSGAAAALRTAGSADFPRTPRSSDEGGCRGRPPGDVSVAETWSSSLNVLV